MNQTLFRIPSRGQLGGVAAGLAERYGIDVAIVRIILAVGLIFTHGIFFWIYIILWASLPVQHELSAARWQMASMDANTTTESSFNATLTNMKNDKNKVWGIILIALGTIFLLEEWLPQFELDKFWPLILIAVGGYIIFKDKNNSVNNE